MVPVWQVDHQLNRCAFAYLAPPDAIRTGMALANAAWVVIASWHFVRAIIATTPTTTIPEGSRA